MSKRDGKIQEIEVQQINEDSVEGSISLNVIVPLDTEVIRFVFVKLLIVYYDKTYSYF